MTSFWDLEVFNVVSRMKSKIQNSLKFSFFLVRPCLNRVFFVLAHFFFLFCYWISSCNYCQNLKQKTNLSGFWHFDIGCSTKSKTWKYCKFSFFVLRLYLNLSFISFVVAFKSSVAITVNFEVIVTNSK